MASAKRNFHVDSPIKSTLSNLFVQTTKKPFTKTICIQDRISRVVGAVASNFPVRPISKCQRHKVSCYFSVVYETGGIDCKSRFYRSLEKRTQTPEMTCVF